MEYYVRIHVDKSFSSDIKKLNNKKNKKEGKWKDKLE